MNSKILFATAAAVLTGLSVLLAALVPDANAGIAPVSVDFQSVKGDRLPRSVKGSLCSATAWPTYEARCLFDPRVTGDMRKVRVVDLRGERSNRH